MITGHKAPPRVAEKTKQMFRILSLDGGGIRGIMTAVWLAELRRLLGRPLYNFFDLIAGTSTGAILAAAIALDLDLDVIIAFYENRGRDIFPFTRLGKRKRGIASAVRAALDMLTDPKYDGKRLAEHLLAVFSEGGIPYKLRDVKCRLLVTAYDVFARAPYMMRSHLESDHDIPVWEAIKSSCSAPVYFPAHDLAYGDIKRPLVDGGMVANNPAACALAEAVHLRRKDSYLDFEGQIILASFGTGSSTRPIQRAQAATWGALEWAFPIIDVLMDGTADATHFICQQILPSDLYFRFQAPLTGASDDLDDASPENINNLKALAKSFLEMSGSDDLQRLATALNTPRARIPSNGGGKRKSGQKKATGLKS